MRVAIGVARIPISWPGNDDGGCKWEYFVSA